MTLQEKSDIDGRGEQGGAADAQQQGSDTLAKSYRYLRLAMVGLLACLAAAVLYQSWQLRDLLGSVSAYYYTPAQAFFVGGLIGLGACMFALKGTNIVEDVFLNLGGVFAVVVAIVRTGRDADYRARSAPAGRRALRCSPGWTAPRSRPLPTPPKRTWTTTCSPSSSWGPSLSSPA